MNPRVLLIAFLAVGGIGGLLFFRALMRPVEKPAGPPPVPTEQVMVATRTIHAGDFVRKNSNIASRVFPVPKVPSGAVLATPADLDGVDGAIAQEEITQGGILRSSQIVRVNAPGFLSAALKPNMRAVSVQVSPVSSVGGLVQPGDRVDLILTQTMHASTGAQSVSARGIALGLRVIGVDQSLFPEDFGPHDPRNDKKAKEPRPATFPTTVTLEVTAEQAVAINVAADMGHLSLAIRSSQGDENTLASVVQDKQIGEVATVNESGATVRVYNGTAGSINVQF
ncbi:Flp pilus assembly protein CpaB [Acetobacter sp. LMG 32666]|uniref:Flp pilus assembly protein CpaB n=1 Tax=Acetobacter sp. LMG 32666 TaxID=2959295 RepID=UPI0030C855B0